MSELALTFLRSLATMLVVGIVPLIIYALSNAGTDFSVKCFVILSRKRLLIGFILIAWLAAVMALIPVSREVLAAVGFGVGQSDTALGLAVGALLVCAVRGSK